VKNGKTGFPGVLLEKLSKKGYKFKAIDFSFKTRLIFENFSLRGGFFLI
jgi:hypothetical protein